MALLNSMIKSLLSDKPKNEKQIRREQVVPQTPVRTEPSERKSSSSKSFKFDIESFVDYDPSDEVNDVINRGLLIQSTLEDYGPTVQLKKYKEEGRVCIFAYKLDRGVTITSIRNLKEDLSLALCAKYIEMCAIKETPFFAIITDNPYTPLDINEEHDIRGKDGTVFDGLFIHAGKAIIESNKASIGFLQRSFRIGFNRAANLMDQLESFEVVKRNRRGELQVNMSVEEFERFTEEL